MSYRLRSALPRLSVFALLLATAACGSFSTASIKDLRLASDQNGDDETTTFATDDTFFVLGTLSNAPDDTKVKAKWIATDAEGQDPDTEIDSVEKTFGSGDITFKLTNDKAWPVGEYEAKIYLNDELNKTLTFEVTEDGKKSSSSSKSDSSSSASSSASLSSSSKSKSSSSSSGAAVDNLDDVKSATIQIIAKGSFVDPEVGERLNAAGAGSGFIIDPSGIAVTNNHVVTGAAIIEVYVGGESKRLSAKVLGVSECSDLAVIDIEGDGYPFLEWRTDATKVGLDVYAAGFPLGDPEFTLKRGIISKAKADGETNWASVAHVLEHDAQINPGNSGGPLVDADGHVVGINYATNSDTNQHFAIAEDQAQSVIDTLQGGDDVDSIGVNGQAVTDGENIAGVWVASVKSGSPADEAGIKGGDIITRLEGLVLGTDGTMKDYCEVLHGHDPKDKLRVEVLRFSDKKAYEGQLNGTKLEETFSFAQALEPQVEQQTGNSNAADYGGYDTVKDDSQAIAMNVPTDWGDTDGSAWVYKQETVGASITAASNRDGFVNGYSTPGVFFGASRMLAERYDPAALLDALQPDMGVQNCTSKGREDYKDPYYTGVYETFENCGDDKSVIVTVAAQPEDKSYDLFVLVQVVADRDLKALDTIIGSFQVIGDLK
ncbi:MAG: trypsin-like peptidase domain-containing protein, partial [Ardenticatenales bacterium]